MSVNKTIINHGLYGDLSYVLNFQKIFLDRKMIVFHDNFTAYGKVKELKLENEYLVINSKDVSGITPSVEKFNFNWLCPLERWLGVFIGGNFWIGPHLPNDNHYFKYLVILKEGANNL